MMTWGRFWLEDERGWVTLQEKVKWLRENFEEKRGRAAFVAKRNQMVEWKLLGKTRMSCVMGYYDLCNNFGKIWTYGEMISLRKFHWEKLEL